jgi:hypothetical protein
MREMFSVLFSTLTQIFTAAGKTTIRTFSAADHLAGGVEALCIYAEAEAIDLNSQAQVEREARITALHVALDTPNALNA